MNIKTTIFLLFLGLFLNQCKKENYQKLGLQALNNFGTNPGNLNAYYYEPKNATLNMPLVVVLHGCTQNAKDISELSDWNKLADLNGFYVLYPEQKTMNNISNCFNWFLPNDNEKNKGENASIKAMVSKMQSEFKVNVSKTYITGFSAGAAMSMVMISAYPDMFQGAAIISGGPYKAANNSLESMSVLSGNVIKTSEEWKDLVVNQNISYVGFYADLAIFHGKDDNVVDFKNAEEIVIQWTAVTGVGLNNKIETNAFASVSDIKRIDYLDIYNKIKVSKFEISNMGHALAINPGEAADNGGKESNYGKDKNFFSSYWAAKFFNLIP